MAPNTCLRPLAEILIVLFLSYRLLVHDCEWRPSDVYLPAAKRELSAVASYLNVDPITGPDATKEKFKSSVENATVIHIGKYYIFMGFLKVAVAVNFVFFYFYSLKLMYMKNKQYKRVSRSLFQLERNRYFSTFKINIESSLVHSMNLFTCLPANMMYSQYISFFLKIQSKK